MNRRAFLRHASGGLAAAAGSATLDAHERPAPSAASDRGVWTGVLRRLADPVLTNLARGTLRARMPVEQQPSTDRRSVTHLEALGRLVAGIAPWLELGDDASAEGRLRATYADLTRRAIANAVDPASPDALNFTRDRQPLVDAAFLAQGVLRAPTALAAALDPIVRDRLVAALQSTRAIEPGPNNWVMFSATVEACLRRLGAEWQPARIERALRLHEQWYKGDGSYGDGAEFHWDYYNSFVIHPMLVDVLGVCRDELPIARDLAPREDERARRYAAIQERAIGPDGSFPPIGRSIAYRVGAFHLLAQSALRRALPDGVSPAQVRGALTAAIRRSIEAPGTFDADGWLQIGFCGHQPGIGETYISTGSLYLCAVGLLPLGLPSSDEFWTAPARPWTSAKAWSGQAFPIDHALAAAAPARAAADGIEGRWKLIAAEDLRADGSVSRLPWGAHPIGSIVVERGWCYLQIMSSDVPSFAAATPVGDQMKSALLGTYIAYSGPCTIDTAEGSITLKVDAAWRPDYVGTTQKRFFRFENGRLLFGPAPSSIRATGESLTRRLTLERAP
jgi:hypothetical protein